MQLFVSSRWTRCRQVPCVALVASLMLASSQLLAQAQGGNRPVEHAVFYRTAEIDGLSIFYREAGEKDAPVLFLLHGFLSSSRMFEPLFARLADRYHLVLLSHKAALFSETQIFEQIYEDDSRIGTG